MAAAAGKLAGGRMGGRATHRLPMVVPVVSIVLLSRSRVSAADTASARSFSSARCRQADEQDAEKGGRGGGNTVGIGSGWKVAKNDQPPVIYYWCSPSAGPCPHPRPASPNPTLHPPTCSSGKTVHLTAAVTGVKRNTAFCSSPSRV